MKSTVGSDARIDPRIRAAYGGMETYDPPNVPNREAALASLQTGDGSYDKPAVPLELYEAVAPSAGLRITTRDIVSAPDGNEIQMIVILPAQAGPLACVYYIHGGGMMFNSCHDPNYRAWGRLLARQGVAVVMPNFRNSLVPSSAPEVAPFPAGLNDCVSGLRWVHDHAAELGIDPAHIVVAGESGGGNLAVASALQLKRDGDLARISGIHIACPYLDPGIDGTVRPSEQENAGILSGGERTNFLAMAYGIAEAEGRNPLAWPAFATAGDLAGLPRTIVNVAECDSLRDEGIAFYRLLLEAGVPSRCIQLMGIVHAIEVDVITCPDVSTEAAMRMATFAKTGI